MPSPFPGVDPYLESQGFWPDFHATFINYWREALAEVLPDAYEARIDERVNLVEVRPRPHRRRIEPDVAVSRRGSGGSEPGIAVLPAPPATATILEAMTVPLEIVEEDRETYIEILHRPDRSLVAVLELLAPANKEEPGLTAYRAKRNALLRHPVHIVEVDLLRGGQHPSLEQLHQAGDYCALIVRAEQRTSASLYRWGIRQRLPALPIPLLEDDPAVWVDLATVFTTTYDRGRYARSIDYSIAPTAVAEADRDWAIQVAQSRPA
jgi:hypothetical protein